MARRPTPDELDEAALRAAQAACRCCQKCGATPCVGALASGTCDQQICRCGNLDRDADDFDDVDTVVE